MVVRRLPTPKRDCYACYDMERGGPHTCPACGRPHGSRLDSRLRPPVPLKYWLDPALDPRPAENDPSGTTAKPSVPLTVQAEPLSPITEAGVKLEGGEP